MFYLVVIYLSPNTCIFCSVVFGLSLYHMFVRSIIYFIYLPTKWGVGRILENNLLLNKKSFGSVYIKPISFVPFCSSLLQTINPPSTTHQYSVLTMGRGPQVMGDQHQPLLLFDLNGHGLFGAQTVI